MKNAQNIYFFIGVLFLCMIAFQLTVTLGTGKRIERVERINLELLWQTKRLEVRIGEVAELIRFVRAELPKSSKD